MKQTFAIIFVVIVALLEFSISFDLSNSIRLDISEPTITNVKGRVSSPRIVGGDEITQAQREIYKYQAGLHFDDSFWCGGSIISPRCVITAAHCVHKKSKAKVFIGLYNLRDISYENTQIFEITRANWVEHKDYNDVTHVNDIAMVNIPTPMKFNKVVGPIPIECNDKMRHENEIVRISGWGRHTDAEVPTSILRAASVRTVADTVCKSTFGTTKFTNTHICVEGKNNIGTCQGDSGGPIVSSIDGKLLGATSYGAEGCVQSHPRVFTRLSSYAVWINANAVDKIAGC